MFLLKCDKNGDISSIEENGDQTHLLKLLMEIKIASSLEWYLNPIVIVVVKS